MMILKKGEKETTERIELLNSSKKQKNERKRKLEVFVNLGNGHHQTNRGKKKYEKSILKEQKIFLTSRQQKSHQRN